MYHVIFFHACTGNSWWVLSSCVYICFIVTLRTNNYNHQFCIACNFFKHKYKLSGGGNCIRKLYELYSIMLVLFFLYIKEYSPVKSYTLYKYVSIIYLWALLHTNMYNAWNLCAEMNKWTTCTCMQYSIVAD